MSSKRLDQEEYLKKQPDLPYDFKISSRHVTQDRQMQPTVLEIYLEDIFKTCSRCTAKTNICGKVCLGNILQGVFKMSSGRIDQEKKLKDKIIFTWISRHISKV